MKEGLILIEKLLAYARTFLSLDESDVGYMRNRLRQILQVEGGVLSPIDVSYVSKLEVPDALLRELAEYLQVHAVCAEEDVERFIAMIMGDLSPRPSAVIHTFRTTKEMVGSEAACEYLYHLSMKNDYIKKSAVDKNLKWDYLDQETGNRLEITVNLSKPEKNNKDIAKLMAKPKTDELPYPPCVLCKENEGFFGNTKIAPRTNLRTLPVTLAGEAWFMQYSPYLYYNEHCIVINTKHVPMAINKTTVKRLFDFVSYLPEYFLGSNAALPIVGGSILNHEHYQGGRHVMPMHDAKVVKPVYFENYTDVEVGILGWYNSAIRLVSTRREQIERIAEKIIEVWENYTDESVDIYANTDDVKHNTLSPIARILPGGKYCLEIILRNNRTDEQYPEGIFHAHPEYHNIKHEGIGLIEAMGLFILPGRLKREMQEIASCLTGEQAYDMQAFENSEHPLFVHRNAIQNLVQTYGTELSKEQAEKTVVSYINDVCKNILYNTAVFKKDEAGQAAFLRFLSKVEESL